MISNRLLIELQYLPPISYFTLLLKYDEIIIEQWEHFQKSSYRNRCYIAGPNGLLRLTVPLEKGKHQRDIIKDVKIAYDEDWKKAHWKSFGSCYRRSPFFEFYERDFQEVFQKDFEYLFVMNLELLKLLLKLLNIDKSISFSDSYIKNPPEGIVDRRSVILPNKPALAQCFEPPKYWQVFEEKTQFFPDISIIDLLFNEGPNALNLLKSSFK